MNELLKKSVNLQHDAHNSLDKVTECLSLLDEWNTKVSIYCKEKEIKLPNVNISPTNYIVAEHFRTHIKLMRDIIDKYHIAIKENG